MTVLDGDVGSPVQAPGFGCIGETASTRDRRSAAGWVPPRRRVPAMGRNGQWVRDRELNGGAGTGEVGPVGGNRSPTGG